MTAAVLALLRRPDLWPAAVRLVPPGWWRRWPPVPVPPGPYRRFRPETRYGASGQLGSEDLIVYLEWCRAMRRQGR